MTICGDFYDLGKRGHLCLLRVAIKDHLSVCFFHLFPSFQHSFSLWLFYSLSSPACSCVCLLVYLFVFVSIVYSPICLW